MSTKRCPNKISGLDVEVDVSKSAALNQTVRVHNTINPVKNTTVGTNCQTT